MLEGSPPSGTGQVAVEQHLATHAGLHPGDRLEVLGAGGWTPVDVSAVVASAEYLWPARSRQEPITSADDFGVLFAPQPLVDALAPGAPAQVLVLLEDAARGGPALAGLESAARGLGTATTTRAEQPSNALLQEDISGFRELALLFPVLFLGAAAMAAYVLLNRRVDAERRIIGTLLASGVPRSAVRRHYVGYGLAAGTLGALVGVSAGAAAAGLVTRYYLAAIDLPERLGVTGAGRPGTVAIGLAFGVVTGAVAALAPAATAARVQPAEAMRDVPPSAAASVSLLERLVPALRTAPVGVRLVLRGIGRHRRRTVLTATGVVLSLLVVLTSWTMVDTMTGLLSVQFDRVSTQDARVDLTSPADAAALSRLAAVPGVARAEPVVQVPVTLVAGTRRYTTALVALLPDTDLHGFLLAGGGTTSLRAVPAGSVLAGQAVRQTLGIGAGDSVDVVGPDGTARTARVEALLAEPLGTYLYAPVQDVGGLAGAVPATSALLRFDPGVDRTSVRRAVTALDGVVAYEDSRSLATAFRSYSRLFYGFVGAMLGLGGVMAFAILYTTMSANVLERRREIATLRAGGVRGRTIGALVTGENLLMTLIGVVPGLLVGVLAGRAFLASYSDDQFHLTLVVRPSTLALSALAVLVVAALSQWPSLRAVNRLDLAGAVRERT